MCRPIARTIRLIDSKSAQGASSNADNNNNNNNSDDNDDDNDNDHNKDEDSSNLATPSATPDTVSNIWDSASSPNSGATASQLGINQSDSLTKASLDPAILASVSSSSISISTSTSFSSSLQQTFPPLLSLQQHPNLSDTTVSNSNSNSNHNPIHNHNMKLDAISSASSSSGASYTSALRTPFAAGSLLQQRADAEKQEIEILKLQLKVREQAGILGAKNLASSHNTGPPAGYFLHHPHSKLTTSASSSSLLSQQQQHQQQPLKFGGPGTLIEKGEARQAQLLERSMSAGAGLLHPATNISKVQYNRSRSKSRSPGEDRVGHPHHPHHSGSSSPRSPGSASNSSPVPNGPLVQFEDENAMIRPGLLLDRAKSSKQSPSTSGMHIGNAGSHSQRNGYGGSHSSSNGLQAGPRSQQASNNSTSSGAYANGARSGRTRIKPLIDVGNIHTGQDMIGPGLLTNGGHHNSSRTAPSGAQSARSPRRNKPLLEF
ncbi:hypothetical protein BG004_003432 [Podila humilis]|nr:hypothetical protein BG004_003432 [Podila humilis]